MKKLILSLSLFACLSFTALASSEQPIENWNVMIPGMTPEQCEAWAHQQAEETCAQFDWGCTSTQQYNTYHSSFLNICSQ